MAIAFETIKEKMADFMNDENSADLIEWMNRMNTISENDEERETAVQNRIDEAVKAATSSLNAEWNARYRNTFFNGVDDTTVVNDESSDEENKDTTENITIEDII